MDKIKKPIILKINDAKQKIADILNDLNAEGVPYYFMESFLNEFTNQAHNNAVAELKEANEFYLKSCIEEDNTKEEETEET